MHGQIENSPLVQPFNSMCSTGLWRKFPKKIRHLVFWCCGPQSWWNNRGKPIFGSVGYSCGWGWGYIPHSPLKSFFSSSWPHFSPNFKNSFAWWTGMQKVIFGYSDFFLLRLFFDPLKGKNPFFKGWLPEAVGIFPAWLFQFRDQIRSVWSWSWPTSKNFNTLLHIFPEYRTVLSRALSDFQKTLFQFFD